MPNFMQICPVITKDEFGEFIVPVTKTPTFSPPFCTTFGPGRQNFNIVAFEFGLHYACTTLSGSVKVCRIAGVIREEMILNKYILLRQTFVMHMHDSTMTRGVSI